MLTQPAQLKMNFLSSNDREKPCSWGITIAALAAYGGSIYLLVEGQCWKRIHIQGRPAWKISKILNKMNRHWAREK